MGFQKKKKIFKRSAQEVSTPVKGKKKEKKNGITFLLIPPEDSEQTDQEWHRNMSINIQ